MFAIELTKMTRPLLAFLIALLQTVAVASPHVIIEPVDRLADGSTVARLTRIIQNFHTEELRPPEDAWEDSIAHAASKTASFCTNVSVHELLGTHTLTNDGQDVLIGKWEVSGLGVKDLWIWDSPNEKVIVLRVSAAALETHQLDATLESLLRWKKYPLGLGALRIFKRSTDSAFNGTGPHETASFAGYFDFSVAGILLRESGYIGLFVSKGFLSDIYPPGALGVNERFPPLAKRIEARATEELIGELGKGFKLTTFPNLYPYERDDVIIAELSKRELSETQIREIALDHTTSFHIVNHRTGTLVIDLEEANRLSRYEDALLTLFPNFVKLDGGGLRDSLIGYVFARLDSRKVVHVALTYLREDVFQRISLDYLKTHGDSPDVLRELEAVGVPGEYRELKQQALAAITGRLRR